LYLLNVNIAEEGFIVFDTGHEADNFNDALQGQGVRWTADQQSL